MNFSNKYEELGRILTQKLRDENYEYYKQLEEFARSMSIKEYYNQPRNPNFDKGLQKLKDERFELLNILDDKQIEVLNRLILSIIDFAAFNILREIEENLDEDNSIGLTIKGEKVEEIAHEFLSGTLFGEYFKWIEKNSKYGNFQH